MAYYGVKLSDGHQEVIEESSWLRAGAMVNIKHRKETGANTLVADVWPEGPCDDIIVVDAPFAGKEVEA